MTELFDAIKANKLEDVEAVIQKDASCLNKANDRGETPLHVAVQGKNVRIVEKLISAGANLNYPTEGTGSCRGYTAAHYAARNGDVDMILALAKHKINWNIQAQDGWSPLHCSVFAGKREATKAMIDQGADVNSATQHGITPLVFATNHGRLQDVKEMVDRGAKLDITDVHGDGLLHAALHYQMMKLFEGEYEMPEVQYDIIFYLTLKGLNVTHKNFEGKLATEYCTPSVQRWLECLAAAKDALNGSATQWNYMTCVSARIENLLGLGLQMKHATDLFELTQAVEKERKDEKKRKQEERATQGGCPIIRSKKNKDQKAPEIPKDGSDPSGGQCPFFNKKKEGAAGADGAPTDHSAMVAAGAPADGSDPSGGKCPHFQKKPPAALHEASVQEVTAAAATVRQQQQPSPVATSPSYAVVAKNDEAPKLNWQTVYENRTTILMMFVSFLLGVLLERKVG